MTEANHVGHFSNYPLLIAKNHICNYKTKLIILARVKRTRLFVVDEGESFINTGT